MTVRNFQVSCLASVGAVFCAAWSSDSISQNALSDDQEQASGSLNGLFAETSQSIQTAMAEHSWPGVAIAVVDRDGILWSETFGVRDRQTSEPVTEETTFSIQSISKVVTATAVMMGVQDGLLDLDVPVTEYLPDFTVNSRFEDRPERRMTLRHLLSHTAGFTHEAPVGNNFNAASPSFDAHVASISNTWLKFPVGKGFSYSNLGIDLAGYILQETFGVPFDSFVRTRVFEPLGMQSSFIDTPARHGDCNTCASGYNRLFTRLPNYIPIAASGGVRMSVEDGGRFIQFHLNRGRVGETQILRSDLIDEMNRQTAQDPSYPGNWYGLGVVSWADEGTYVLNHNGRGFGFSATVRWYPEYGIGMALFTNSLYLWEWGNQDPGAILLDAMIEGRLTSKLDDASIPTSEEFFAQIPEAVPNNAEWTNFVGRYCATQGGGYELDPSFPRSTDNCDPVFVGRDGYLHHTDSNGNTERLVEHLPGLFFRETSGEAFDFRSTPPTFRNIELRKVE